MHWSLGLHPGSAGPSPGGWRLAAGGYDLVITGRRLGRLEEDVVTASLRGLELGEVVCAPGVEDAGLLDTAFRAGLAAFGAQSPELARRYRAG